MPELLRMFVRHLDRIRLGWATTYALAWIAWYLAWWGGWAGPWVFIPGVVAFACYAAVLTSRRYGGHWWHRHDYNKPWRCAGWSGPGWRTARVSTCPGGSLATVMTAYHGRFIRGWSWRPWRCPACRALTVPYVTRWLDPSWYAWHVRSWRAARRQTREYERAHRNDGDRWE